MIGSRSFDLDLLLVIYAVIFSFSYSYIMSLYFKIEINFFISCEKHWNLIAHFSHWQQKVFAVAFTAICVRQYWNYFSSSGIDVVHARSWFACEIMLTRWLNWSELKFEKKIENFLVKIFKSFNFLCLNQKWTIIKFLTIDVFFINTKQTAIIHQTPQTQNLIVVRHTNQLCF